VNLKCADPCPNTCGIGAQCTTKNHNPICACPPGFTGDPFSQCTPQRKYACPLGLLIFPSYIITTEMLLFVVIFLYKFNVSSAIVYFKLIIRT
jgi:hypothetical protein